MIGYFCCELCTRSIHFLFDGRQKCKHSVNTKLKEEEHRKKIHSSNCFFTESFPQRGKRLF